MPVFPIILAVITVLLLIIAVVALFDGDEVAIPVILAILFGIWCWSSFQKHWSEQSDYMTVQSDYRTVQDACVSSNARPVPSSATIGTYKDNRAGPIYPCSFMLDLGIPTGVDGVKDPEAMALGPVNSQMISDQNFKAKGSIGGLMLLGTGGGFGSFKASSETSHVPTVGFMAKTERGLVDFVVESKQVSYEECDDDCVPTVSVWTSSDPLFVKNSNDSPDRSIWSMAGEQDGTESLLPDGVPASPGQTVQALGRVVVSLPPDLMPSASSLSSIGD